MSATAFVICAQNQLDKQYKWGTAGPDTFDCSGLVAYCYEQAMGHEITRSSHQQYTMGVPISYGEAKPGDLLFWNTDGSSASHVAIYEADGVVIHAMNEYRDVTRSRGDAPMGGPFLGARRIFPQEKPEGAPAPKTETPPGQEATAPVNFGTIPHPPHEVHIVPKPWEGAGFDRVSPRKPVGMCMHKWWGYGDKLSLVRLFGSGGERQADALTDYSITQEGELVMLNEPEGTRSPWANGGSDGLEGDGVLFTRTLGSGAINSRLISVEFEGRDEPLTAEQVAVGTDLWAYWFDRVRVPWSDYPLFPQLGIVTDLDHYEFATKACPFAGARAQRSQFQDIVRGKLKEAQTGATTTDPAPVSPPKPVEPNHDWLPDGMTEKMVIGLFGTGTRYDPDGAETEFGFDAKGLISNAWLSRGREDHIYPMAGSWWRMVDLSPGVGLRNMVSFSNGWILVGTTGDRSTWKWL